MARPIRPGGAAPLAAAALLGGAILLAPPGPRAGAAPAEGREGVPRTHRLLTTSPPNRTKWLLAVPPKKGDSPPAAGLIALNSDGEFYHLRLQGGSSSPRIVWEQYPVASSLMVHVPPVRVSRGRFAGAGRDGVLYIVDVLKRDWEFVRPSVPLSALSRPASLAGDAVAAVARDGSILLFRRRRGHWVQTQRIPPGEDGDGGAMPDALPVVADLAGDGGKHLIVPASPSGRYAHGVLGDALEPTELRAYAYAGGRLRFKAAYRAGGEGVFEALGP
ncbi:MAG: hypothetical protein V3V62_00800, partial [bacterium]